MFKLNVLEVLTILVPTIVILWRFWVFILEERKTSKLYEEDQLRRFAREALVSSLDRFDKKMNELFKADLSSFPIECFHCKAKIIFNGPGLIGTVLDEENSTENYKIFQLEPTIYCPECHKKVDNVLVPKEYLSLWDSRVKFREVKKDKPMGQKVLLKGYSCEYCGHAVSFDKPVHGEYFDHNKTVSLSEKFHCPNCNAEEWRASEPVLWDNKIMKKPTVQEIMDEHNDKQKRQRFVVHAIVFVFVWLTAAMLFWLAQFVPWSPIFWSFVEFLGEVIWVLTRWWTLLGLIFAVAIFCHYHKQAIRDKLDYYKNISRTRKRYRAMTTKKETLKEEEVRAFVNQVNGTDRLEEITGIKKGYEEANVSEGEIPW